ncbi:MAG: DUF2219 family protein [Flavobacteriia bacterium]|nr:DUF2219 family protein [Flavobacteriia bacterium]
MKKTAIAFFLCTTTLYSQEECQPLIDGGSITFEQDVVLEWVGLSDLNSDQNYTQGFQLKFSSPALSNTFDFVFPSYSTNQKLSFSQPAQFGLQFTAFTPDSLPDPNIILGDRPYSTVFGIDLINSRLYYNGETRSHRYMEAGAAIIILGIPNVARDLQTAIHEGMNDGNTKPPYNPEGWHNQISNGGEPSAMVMAQWRRPSSRTAQKINEAIDGSGEATSSQSLSWLYGFQLGYQTNATVGFDYKLGKVSLNSWHSLSGNNLTSISMAAGAGPSEAKAFYESSNSGSFYFFVNGQLTASIYNGSLHGQFRNREAALPYGETGFLLGNFRVGAVAQWRHIGIELYGAFRTAEMWNEYSRIHSWGGISLNYNWR